MPDSAWPVFEGRAEIILLEGWCVGALPEQSRETLDAPLNSLESMEDQDGFWRGYVNQCLRNQYAVFFEQIDCLIMLKAPSMECVLEWRTLQEHKLRSKNAGALKQGEKGSGQPTRMMSDAQVARFIMHYERITRACLAEMPARADAVIHVDQAHRFSEPLIRQRQ